MLLATSLALPLAAQTATAAAPADVSTLGVLPDTAAGSCWEIKQARPSAADGAYWLLTPLMSAPQQFYCDMTTDGGGWVLVGKGRDAWTTDYDGKGSAAELLSPVTSPMSSTTHQLPSQLVDQLLDGARVDSLTDGVRLRRARDGAGSTWQEARIRFANRTRWTWTFGAEWALAGYSFDGSAGSGGTSPSFGLDNSYRRVVNTTDSTKGYRLGFAYGSQVAGSSSASTYLYSAVNGAGGAIPYTQVYLRPKVLSSDSGFQPIGDAGTAAVRMSKGLRSTALASPWGVSGTKGATAVEGSVEVQAFTQSGDRMYVGGNFQYVQQDGAGTGRVEQSFLAAFDVNTGEWDPSFRPVLNEQVRALATLPNGQIVAGGDFTVANGQPATAIVALDPATGATSTTWQVSLQNRVTGGVLKVRALHVAGPYVYIGGALTHFVGGTRSTWTYMRMLGRVSATNGTPSTGWNPNFNGAVADVSTSADLSRVYASGWFTTSNGNPAKNAAAVLNTAGAPLASPTWAPVWSNTKSYQWAIREVGNRIWVGGSEHDLFRFDTTSFARVAGDIFKSHGDVQTITSDRGVVYAGCHCDGYDYSGAYTWPTLGAGWTQADAMGWFGAWDAETGERLPSFVPTFNLRLNQGIWALQPDSNGTVWAGGDILSVRTNAQQARWSGGFARFPLADTDPAPTPASFRVLSETGTSVTLGWDAVTDPAGALRYQVLRDDRPIGTSLVNSITVPKDGSNRFFVRTIDAAGNVSASTPVLVAGAGTPKPVPAFTWSADHAKLSVDGSGSTSPNGAIVSYAWEFGDGAIATGPTASHTYLAAGQYTTKLTVTDSAGESATLAQVVTVSAPASAGPTDVYGKEVFGQTPWAYYRLDESAGPTARDFGPDGRDGTYTGWITYGVQGALVNSSDAAMATYGLSGYATSPRVDSAPNEFSIGVWFKTSSSYGGRLMGFASSNSGTSSTVDRHLFLQSNGRLVFGVTNGGEQRVTSAAAYNDGNWHQAVATMSPGGGMRLHVDGVLVGTNATTSGAAYAGYWRVGGDKIWSGALTGYLSGSLDEATVFTRALTATEISEQYRLGSTVVGTPVTVVPTASFTATINETKGVFDASASVDPDGTIEQYVWDFGDGSQGAGQLVTHTFASAGTYTVTLTVHDNDGALGSATRQVTTEAPPAESVVVANGSAWRWRYVASAPPADWNTLGFDPASWQLGNAVLGFGTPVATNIDTFATTTDRPRAAYFTRSFDIADPTKVVRLVLQSVADDGVVIYVNGTEVARSNMPTGTVTYLTFASSARRTTAANSAPVIVEVPVGLLVQGRNVVSAETHLNYRSTPDASFDLRATLTAYQ